MAADGEIVVRVDPISGDELHEQRPIKSTFTAIIDIFRHGRMAQLGKPQSGGELAIKARTPFAIEQKPKPFGMGELFALAVGNQVVERLGHAGQADGIQLIKGRMCKHVTSP